MISKHVNHRLGLEMFLKLPEESESKWKLLSDEAPAEKMVGAEGFEPPTYSV